MTLPPKPPESDAKCPALAEAGPAFEGDASFLQKVRMFVDDQRLLTALLRTITSKRTLRPRDLDTVLDVTIEKIAEAIRAEAAMVFFVAGDGWIEYRNAYYSPAVYANDDERRSFFDRKVRELYARRIAPGQGYVGRVIAGGKPVMIHETESEPGYRVKLEDIYGFPVRSMITVPLIAQRVIGAIRVLNKRDAQDGRFNAEDLMLVEDVAEYSAKAIQKVVFADAEFSDIEMARYVARLTRHDCIEFPREFRMDERLVSEVGLESIGRYRIIPLRKTGGRSIEAAMSDPLDVDRRDDFQLMSGFAVDQVYVAPESHIAAVLENASRKGEREMKRVVALVGKRLEEMRPEVTAVAQGADEHSSPIIRLSSAIIEEAGRQGASDIHIEPFEDEVVVRYRIDGSIKSVLHLPPAAIRPLSARFKIMARLDISEKRLPQDGRIHYKDFNKEGIDLDLRVSTSPMIFGEKVVMRLLDRSATLLSLDKIGFSERNLALYRDLIRKPYGMILHVGPTGSGKTSSLYAAVSEINDPDTNIQTAEDPVEYVLKGVNQMQVHREIGLTFAAALRSFLRQDPDILLVGEIRDQETAEIAVKAALTGHLVFSTLHTNDAAGTIARFLDMGIEPVMVSSAVLCVCAQRLMRKLCPDCKESYRPSPGELRSLGEPPESPLSLYRPLGCRQCSGIGYKGRVGVHEVLVVGPRLRELIHQRASSDAIRQAALDEGMVPIYKDAIAKVKEGVSSLAEALNTVQDG